MGINVNLVFAVTFALGSGWRDGCGLGIDVLGLDPTFPLKYMVYFLLVVAVGGAGTIKGALSPRSSWACSTSRANIMSRTSFVIYVDGHSAVAVPVRPVREANERPGTRRWRCRLCRHDPGRLPNDRWHRWKSLSGCCR
jgi:hypothetical protein